MTSYAAIFPPTEGEHYDAAIILEIARLQGGTAFASLIFHHEEQMQLIRMDAYLVFAGILIFVFVAEPWCWVGFVGGLYCFRSLLSEIRLNLLARMAGGVTP